MKITFYNIILIIQLLICFCSYSQDKELFSWETAKVNNKLPMTVSLREFEKMYKKADSIIPPKQGQTCETADEASVKMVYYKGVRYELDNGILNFREIDFSIRKNMYIQHQDDWFDNTTTLKSFSKTYPESASLIEMEDDDTDDPIQIVSLLPLETDADCIWQFYFKKGKLKRIECEFSCN